MQGKPRRILSKGQKAECVWHGRGVVRKSTPGVVGEQSDWGNSIRSKLVLLIFLIGEWILQQAEPLCPLLLQPSLLTSAGSSTSVPLPVWWIDLSCPCPIKCLCPPFSIPALPHSQPCISCWQTYSYGRVVANKRHWRLLQINRKFSVAEKAVDQIGMETDIPKWRSSMSCSSLQNRTAWASWSGIPPSDCFQCAAQLFPLGVGS